MIIEIVELRKKLRKLRKYHLILCLLGVLLSAYSVNVEINVERDPSYSALCDISATISCTAVFGSEFGKGFGIIGKIAGHNSTLNQPNGIFGVISYSTYALASRFEYLFLAKTMMFLGVMGVALSVYLAYVLFYILNDMCVVCVSVYMLNLLLVVFSIMYYGAMRSLLALTINSAPPQTEMVKKRV